MRGLIQYFHAPAPPRIASLVGTTMIVVGASYCICWSALHGYIVTLKDAVAWAAIAFVPWYAAFEANKWALRQVESRRGQIAAIAAILVTAVVAAGLLHRGIFAAHGHTIRPLSLHIAVHFPETIIVALLSVLSALLATPRIQPRAANDRELPVAAERIRWIKSAGNYVEIATPARVEMHRMTLGEAERLLDPRDFVRVNRTTIVARALIVRVKPGAKAGLIELQDGRAVPIGQAYRANFADAA